MMEYIFAYVGIVIETIAIMVKGIMVEIDREED